MKVQTCEHPACSCQVTDGDRFCSDGCREAAKDVSRNDLCNCGHGACEREK